MPGAHRARAAGALAVATALLAGCAGQAARPPPQPPQPDTGAGIAALAASLVGAPYQFGGADAAGFDCSGLALYVHERFGLAIPRTARQQRHAAHAVPVDQLSPGDLVFFRTHSHHVDHVGVYVGDGRFVHAPRAGVAVAYADLAGSYYQSRLIAAGRFWDGFPAATTPR